MLVKFETLDKHIVQARHINSLEPREVQVNRLSLMYTITEYLEAVQQAQDAVENVKKMAEDIRDDWDYRIEHLESAMDSMNNAE